MNYQKKTVRDIDVKGKKILLRCDFNVPQDKKTGAITSDKRIVAALPTIRYLLDQGAAGDRLLSPWKSPSQILTNGSKSRQKRAKTPLRSLRTSGARSRRS